MGTRPVKVLVVAVAVAVVLGAGLTSAVALGGRSHDTRRRVLTAAPVDATSTVVPPVVTGDEPSTTAAVAPGAEPPSSASPPPTTWAITTSTPPAVRKPKPAAVKATPPPTPGGPFRGFAAWVDVYDWSAAYTKGAPKIGPEAVDVMAAHGVQVLEIQSAKAEQPGGVLEPDLLGRWIARAHARGLRVVVWYLPTLVDAGVDVAKLTASAQLGVEGLGVDIESRAVADPTARSAALVHVTGAIRAATRLPLQAITLPGVATDVINLAYWPGFPWHAIASAYDVWTPMGYWTNRTPQSGYRDAYRYTRDNINLLRSDLGNASAVVTVAGGLAEQTTTGDVAGYIKACAELGCVGGGLYDFRTTADGLWPILAVLRR